MNEKTPARQVSEWLADLGAALERNDAEGAAELFGAERRLINVHGGFTPILA